ncbi:MAG TPA: SGNH/GDSL hydrolase family protein [Labilithrix sp.]|jgi:lysophospholipase L1-like esterase
MLRARAALALLPLLLAACAAQSDDAASGSEDITGEDKPRLLAIGDSITFAWNPLLETDMHKVDARKYPGYTDMLGADLGLGVDNGACPGETSGAMLDKNAEDNGCRDNRAAYALHTSWGDHAPQIDFATSYLRDAIAKGKAPELVVMTMGGNDLLVMEHHCTLPSLLNDVCKLAKLPFTVHAFGDHISQIAKDIDATGYKGTFVVISTYAPDYSDVVAKLALTQMNGELKEHVEGLAGELQNTKVVVADGYGAFEAVASQHGGKTCETGLLIKKADGTCDIHPTQAGHRVLADAVKKALGR